MKPIIQILFFFTLLSFSSFTYADYQAWSVKNGSSTIASSFISPTDACQKAAQENTRPSTYVSNTSSECVLAVQYSWGVGTNTFSIFNFTQSGECPSPYINEGGYCVEEPVEQCPKGQFDYGDGCENICTSGNEVKATYICGSPASTQHTSDAGDGGVCSYNWQSVTIADVSITTDTGESLCTNTYISTGEYIPDTQYSDETVPEPTAQEKANKDNQQTQSETNNIPGELTTNPDGSTEQTNQETTVTTSDSGKRIYSDDNYIYIENSDGTLSQYTKTTTEITNPDGSKTEIISIDKTVKTPQKDTTVIDQSTGSTTNITTNSYNYDYSQTTTNVYNSAGELVSSETTSTGNDADSDGDGQADCVPSDTVTCSKDGTAGQPQFDSGDGSWWESQYPDGLSGIWDSKSESLNNTAFHQWLDGFSFASSGVSPVWAVPMDLGIVNFGTVNLQVPDYVWSFIGLCMIITALFTARALIFGG